MNSQQVKVLYTDFSVNQIPTIHNFDLKHWESEYCTPEIQIHWKMTP